MYRLFWALRRGVSAALLLAALARVASAQAEAPFNVEVVAPLPAVGRVETLQKAYELFPLQPDVFIQQLDFPGDSSFRIHFSVLAPKDLPAGSWSVKILNFENDQERWTFDPESSDRSIWSPVIKGSRARAVVSAKPAVAGKLQVLIDKVAHMQSITTPQTEINKKLMKIAEATADIKRAGRSVALLIIQQDDNNEQPVPCTGFLVGSELLMTNRHCIRSGSEAKFTDVQFDYDVDNADPVQVGVKELVLTSCDLDFVLLRLNKSFACASAACSGPYERASLALAPNVTLTPGKTQLVAIQHPNGEAKQVSLKGCLADQLSMVGSSSSPTDFAHTCDTKYGSSGTPVQLISDKQAVGAVVGLHHIGFRIDSVNQARPKKVNRAVSVKEIIAYITRLKPELLRELTIQ